MTAPKWEMSTLSPANPLTMLKSEDMSELHRSISNGPWDLHLLIAQRPVMQAAAAHALRELTKDSAVKADWCSGLARCMEPLKACTRCVGSLTARAGAKPAKGIAAKGVANSDKREPACHAVTSPLSRKEVRPPQPKFSQPCALGSAARSRVGCHGERMGDSAMEALKHPQSELVPIIASQDSGTSVCSGPSEATPALDTERTLHSQPELVPLIAA